MSNNCYLCCGLKGDLSTDGKSNAQLIGFGRCDVNKCNSRPAAPKGVKTLGDEFFNGVTNCGNPYSAGSAPEDSRVGRAQGTPGTSSKATIGFGRVDLQVGCCLTSSQGAPLQKYSANKYYLFNMLR